MNIKQANKVLSKLSSIDSDGARLNYLRKINHFVFEELLLSAFKKKGYKIIRNKRYTGDGGIDGQIIKDGKKILIQAKRYSGYINAEDVVSLGEVVQRKKADEGFFVHTGKTGAKSIEKKPSNITIISGSQLLKLVSIKE